MKRFSLTSEYLPAGDQPGAIKSLIEGLKNGLASQTLLGVTGSGKTFTIANIIDIQQRPTMIIAPNKTLAAQLYGEMREFFPNNAVEYFVSYYDYYQPEAYVPTTDTYIEKDASINEHIEQMRLSATKAILERKDTIIVATVSAIYGLGDPSSYLKMVLHLDRGDSIEQRTLLRRLTELQYTRNEIELHRGMFRTHGDVIDIFPAESEREAIRVQLFDNEIESISRFDPLTGAVSQNLPRVTIHPKTHYVTQRQVLLDAVESIKIELKERLKELESSNKLVEGLEDRQLDRLAEKLQKQLDNYDDLSERYGDQDEELDQIEDLPEFKDLIEIQKEKIMRQMRKDLKDMVVDGKDKRATIITASQLLSAMDLVGGGGVASGAAKKVGGLF